ncbi:MAG: TIGR03790 family protein [Verrucomicrobiota bacterium]
MSFLFLTLHCGAAIPDARATVVVFNETDPSSVSLAGYYAEKRGIPFDHLIGLTCTLDETISRVDYENTIAAPLLKAFLAHGWWKKEADLDNGRVWKSTIRYLAVIRGIPLKIAPVPEWEGDKPVARPVELNHNEAAVDSELATLGLNTRQISGPVENPCFQNSSRAQEAPPAWLLRVCRLDAAHEATVRRMINDALAAEKTGLWGFAYVDSRGLASGPHYDGDTWLRELAADITSHGMVCIHDQEPTLFPEHYPMSRAALYFGWYSEEVQGVFTKNNVRFVPGAVAVHLHSFSASTLRMPLKNWCAPLLEMGAAATLGNVYEPYLPLTTHLDIFERMLRTGSTFADAAYAAQPVLSWMATFIGDPLYRPFNPQAMAKPAKAAAEYVAYREGANLWAQNGWEVGEPALQARGRGLKSGVIYEGLGLLQAAKNDPDAALASWDQARRFYNKQDADSIRCALHSIALLRKMGKTDAALALAREQSKKFRSADAAARLWAIQLELAPPPSPSPTPVSPDAIP